VISGFEVENPLSPQDKALSGFSTSKTYQAVIPNNVINNKSPSPVVWNDIAMIGVLALQGDFREHKQVFERLGTAVKEVRLPKDLQGLHGLVIPGGESTTITKLIKIYEFDKALVDFNKKGGAVWGTCAGAIVVSSEVVGYPEQPHLNLIDIAVERNAYGRQVDSFEANVDIAGTPFHTIFIRAPRIAKIGKTVKVLATFKDDPIMVTQNNVLVTVFHPELTPDTRVHQYFLDLTQKSQPQVTT
jgi:pyridoxal 5'-phosphate synthase pdxT subunit